MDQHKPSDDQRTPAPHSLIPPEQPNRSRYSGLVLVASAALIVGVLAAFVWLTQSQLTDDMAVSDVAGVELPPAQMLADDTATPSAPALPDGESRDASIETESTLSAPLLAQSSAPSTAQQSSAAAPSLRATNTPTPVAFAEAIEAVTGLGGASLWNSDGMLVAQLEQGALLSASRRSADGVWIYGVDEHGNAGWIATEELIVFDVDRLAPETISIIPLTPTPQSIAAASESVVYPQDSGGQTISLPSPTATVAASGKGLAPAHRMPTIRIALQDQRLNIRAGPGSSYRVIAKAFPDEMYSVLGVNAGGDWLQLQMPEVEGGFGWAAMAYVKADAPLQDVPTSSAISNAPYYNDAGPANEAPASVTIAPPAPTVSVTATRPAPNRLGPPKLGNAADAHSTAFSDSASLSGKLVIQQEWGGSIYLYDFASGDLRLLTGGFDPSLSPDGTKVAFTRDGGENGVYIIDISTGIETLVFGGREGLRSPKFSPDGEFIVFERNDESIQCKSKPWRCRLAVPSPDGDLPESEDQPSLARIRTDGSDYWDPMDLPYARVPDWSSDGIVYQSLAGIQVTQNEPSVDTREVYHDILKKYEMDPDWQPNGDTIVFQQKEGSHWELYAVNPDGNNLRPLTRPPQPLAESFPNNVSPAWSPDGRHIVFLSNRTPQNTAGEWAVWVMDEDGSNQRRLPIELPFVYTYVMEQMVDWGP